MAQIGHPLLSGTQLGAVLQAARRGQKLTQKALASHINLSQSRVSHLELNAHELSVEQLLTWCAALGLELSVVARNIAEPSKTSTTAW